MRRYSKSNGDCLVQWNKRTLFIWLLHNLSVLTEFTVGNNYFVSKVTSRMVGLTSMESVSKKLATLLRFYVPFFSAVEITWLNGSNYDVTNGILQHKCSLNKITWIGINSELGFSLMKIFDTWKYRLAFTVAYLDRKRSRVQPRI